jgi:hypothetical protein
VSYCCSNCYFLYCFFIYLFIPSLVQRNNNISSFFVLIRIPGANWMHYQAPSRFVLYIYHIKMIDDQYLWDVREQYLLWLFKSSTVSVHKWKASLEYEYFILMALSCELLLLELLFPLLLFYIFVHTVPCAKK